VVLAASLLQGNLHVVVAVLSFVGRCSVWWQPIVLGRAYLRFVPGMVVLLSDAVV